MESEFDSDVDPEALDNDDEVDKPTSGDTQDERYLDYLIALLSARQQRQNVLSDASSKLSLVRNLMGTKGSSARNVTDKQSSAKKQNMTNLVAQGKVTSNGLALPGNEDDDNDDEEPGKKKGMRIFKWSKERKR